MSYSVAKMATKLPSAQ